MGCCCSCYCLDAPAPNLYTNEFHRELRAELSRMGEEGPKRRGEPAAMADASARRQKHITNIIQILGKYNKPEKGGLPWPSRTASMLNQAGEREFNDGFYATAEALFDQCFKFIQKHPFALRSFNQYDWFVVQLVGFEETSKMYKDELLRDDDPNPADNHPLDNPHTAICLNNRAWCLLKLGQVREGVTLQKDALDMQLRLKSDGTVTRDSLLLALFLGDRGTLLMEHAAAQQAEEAINLLRQSLSMYRRLFQNQPVHYRLARSMLALAAALQKVGHVQEAASLFNEAEMIQQQLAGGGGGRNNMAGGGGGAGAAAMSFMCCKCGAPNTVAPPTPASGGGGGGAVGVVGGRGIPSAVSLGSIREYSHPGIAASPTAAAASFPPSAQQQQQPMPVKVAETTTPQSQPLNVAAPSAAAAAAGGGEKGSDDGDFDL